jgi:hypothetical protein
LVLKSLSLLGGVPWATYCSMMSVHAKDQAVAKSMPALVRALVTGVSIRT